MSFIRFTPSSVSVWLWCGSRSKRQATNKKRTLKETYSSGQFWAFNRIRYLPIEKDRDCICFLCPLFLTSILTKDDKREEQAPPVSLSNTNTFLLCLSFFLTSTAFVDTKAKYGIPLSRYTVFLQNCPLARLAKRVRFFFAYFSGSRYFQYAFR